MSEIFLVSIHLKKNIIIIIINKTHVNVYSIFFFKQIKPSIFLKKKKLRNLLKNNFSVNQEALHPLDEMMMEVVLLHFHSHSSTYLIDYLKIDNFTINI